VNRWIDFGGNNDYFEFSAQRALGEDYFACFGYHLGGDYNDNTTA
jgi:hypothetical protein